jgi:hypothetical protein
MRACVRASCARRVEAESSRLRAGRGGERGEELNVTGAYGCVSPRACACIFLGEESSRAGGGRGSAGEERGGGEAGAGEVAA